MSDMFNEDMEIEILSRLPVTYLLRLRCVCKSWRALIKSPGFIRKHLQHNRELLEYGNAPLFATAADNRKLVLSWIPSNVNHDEETLVEVPPNVDIDSLLLYNDILGPVNGIYCAIRHPVIHRKTKTINPDTRDNLFLCNPALREVKALPKVMCSKENYDETTTYGFGYDSKTEDFKVIAISESKYPPCTRVFVFSSCSHSWRQIEYDAKSLPALPLKPENAFFTSQADGGGVVHWMSPDHIISFDFGKEVFRFSNLPNHELPSTKEPLLFLAVLNESIHVILRKIPCLNYYDVHGGDRKCILDDGCCWEIWVMKEYGVKESWTKLYDTARVPLAFFPIGFRNNNKEILFRTVWTDQVVSYDPICNQSKKILQTHAYKAFTYMESLVSVNEQSGGSLTEQDSEFALLDFCFEGFA